MVRNDLGTRTVEQDLIVLQLRIPLFRRSTLMYTCSSSLLKARRVNLSPTAGGKVRHLGMRLIASTDSFKGWRGNFLLSAAEQWLKLELTKNFKVCAQLVGIELRN